MKASKMCILDQNLKYEENKRNDVCGHGQYCTYLFGINGYFMRSLYLSTYKNTEHAR